MLKFYLNHTTEIDMLFAVDESSGLILRVVTIEKDNWCITFDANPGQKWEDNICSQEQRTMEIPKMTFFHRCKNASTKALEKIADILMSKKYDVELPANG